MVWVFKAISVETSSLKLKIKLISCVDNIRSERSKREMWGKKFQMKDGVNSDGGM